MKLFAPMQFHLLFLIFVILLSGCRDCGGNAESDRGERDKNSFVLDRSAGFTLVPPIPAGDQWLESFRSAYEYGEGWETWVWRKTDIDLGEGISVYARDEDEVQFLINGVPELGEIVVNFRDHVVGQYWSYSGSYIANLTPSKDYFVLITSNPRIYYPNGMNLREEVKTTPIWGYLFKGEKLTCWKLSGFRP